MNFSRVNGSWSQTAHRLLDRQAYRGSLEACGKLSLPLIQVDYLNPYIVHRKTEIQDWLLDLFVYSSLETWSLIFKLWRYPQVEFPLRLEFGGWPGNLPFQSFNLLFPPLSIFFFHLLLSLPHSLDHFSSCLVSPSFF